MRRPVAGGYRGAMRTVAIVPLKALDRAKGRLAGELDPAARRELAGWMLNRVVEACLSTRSLTRVLVVAGDEAGADLARAAGAEAVLQHRPGLNAALSMADDAVGQAEASLVVAADLPLASPEDLERVVAAAPPGPAVVVVPTEDGGTGVLYRRPARVVRTAYGPDSARVHLRLAVEAGVPAVRLQVPGLALDIDTPAQLAAWRARFPARRPGT